MCTKACLVVKNEDCIILGINSSKLNSALTKYIFKYICIRMHVRMYHGSPFHKFQSPSVSQCMHTVYMPTCTELCPYLKQPYVVHATTNTSYVCTLGSRASFSPSSCSAPSGSLPTACLTHGVVPASGQCRSQPARACPSPAVRTQHAAHAHPQ